MPDDKDLLGQDDIDDLLKDMRQDKGKGAPAAPARGGDAKADPSLDPAAWGLSEEDLQAEKPASKAAGKGAAPGQSRDVPLEDFTRGRGESHTGRSLEFVMDIPLTLTVEVGRTRMTIGDLLNLGPGSIVELQKLAGEPLEVFVNDKLVARGEAVIVNEKFGIRLTDVISKAERIESLA